MAIEWKFQLIEGNNAEKTIAGWSIDMSGIATGYTGTPGGNIYAAITDISTGCPQLGDSHPNNADAVLRRIQVVSFTHQDVRAIFQYRDRWSVANLTVGATLNQDQTNVGSPNGTEVPEEMEVEYTYPDDYKLNPDLAGETVKQGGLANKLLPNMERVYTVKSDINPEQIAADYVGKCNSVGWKGFAVYTWLCTAITGVSADGGITWTTTLRFQYKRGDPITPSTTVFYGWATWIYFIDPLSGKPPSDIVEFEGYKSYDLYEKIDFNQLGI